MFTDTYVSAFVIVTVSIFDFQLSKNCSNSYDTNCEEEVSQLGTFRHESCDGTFSKGLDFLTG